MNSTINFIGTNMLFKPNQSCKHVIQFVLFYWIKTFENGNEIKNNILSFKMKDNLK